MSKPQSNKAENNISLVAGGLIGLGCLIALGVGLITLPVAIGIGAVVAGGFGAKELMNMREEKKAIDPNQARYEKASQQGFKEINQGRGPLNEAQYESDSEFSSKIIAKSAFDEVAYVIRAHQQKPSSRPV